MLGPVVRRACSGLRTSRQTMRRPMRVYRRIAWRCSGSGRRYVRRSAPGTQLRHHLDHRHQRGTRQGGTVATAIIYCFKSQRRRSVSITRRVLDSQRRHSRMERGRAGMADQDGVRRRGGDLGHDLIECQIARDRR